MTKHFRDPGRGLACLVFATVAVLLWGATVSADSMAGFQGRFDEASAQFNRSHAIALSVLKKIKHIDSQFRLGDGTPIDGRAAEVQAELVTVKLLADNFDIGSLATDDLLGKLEADLAKNDDGSTTNMLKQVRVMREKTNKYQRAVGLYYGKTIEDFGEPAATSPMMAGLPTAEKLSITGEFTGGLAKAQYKRPNANPEVTASSTDITLGVRAQYAAAEGTSILGHLSHESKVERREIALTNFGTSVVRNFSPTFTGTAGLDIQKYSDKDNEAADFSDLGLFAGMNFLKGNKRYDAELRRVSRGYGNFKPADYSTTTLNASAYMPMGTGKLKLRLRYLSKSTENEAVALSFTDFNPGAVYIFSPTGSEAGLSYQKIGHGEVDDCPLDVKRIKGHLHMVKRSDGKVVRYGPEINLYSFPNADDNNYRDLKLIHQTSVRTRSIFSAQWDAALRMYSSETMFDFAQVQYRRSSRPIGSGRYSKFNAALRYYIESSDDEDSLRFAAIHPPHTIDLRYSIGWVKFHDGWIRQYSIGPVIAHKMYIDTERSDAFDEDLVDVDFVFRNPANSAQAGVEAGLHFATSTGITGKADFKYMLALLYNSDPSRTTSIIDLNIRTTYPINRDWMLDGIIRVHRTKAEIESAADLNKYDIAVQVRYLFDIQR